MAVNVAPDRSPERLRSLSRGVVDNVLRLRAVQVDLAKSLLELRRADRFRLFETTTFPLYCERVGLSVAEGRDLCASAEASEVRPEVGESLGAGNITLKQAGMVGEVQRRPELLLPGEDWLREAEQRTTRDLLDLLDRRKEQVRLREDPLPLQLLVSRTGANAFRRCRELVSRKAGHLVSPSETFETVCDDYLQRHDPERAAARLAEKDKAEAPQKGNGAARAWVDGRRRAVPEWAKREIVRRFGDRCWVKDCPDRTFLQNAHLRPARAGASNFPWEQARWCSDHHRQYDAGEWFLVPKKDGSIVMFDKRGVKVGDLIRWDEVLRNPPERPPP